ncbi:MAG TPA: WXG100 family type VII secretion target [Streptosporangiaceae bacterium]|nr:WXG100 family type VII secretion target [Streptosporangiaceae bacterium]
MSALDEVAALPGGGAVAAVAAQVHGNPGAIRDIANRWSEAVGDCVGHAGTVRAAVADVTQDWQGSSATAFTAFMGRFGAAAHGAQQALNTAAVTLRGVAGTLEEAQVSVESICENLLGEVSRLRAAHPRATSAQLNDQISGLTGEAADAARVKVAEAQQTLILARHTLSGDLSRLSRTFSALPAAGTADFMRGWGTPAGWRATSRGNVSGTGNGTAGSDGPASPDSGGAPGPSGSGVAPLPSAASGTPASAGSLDGLPVSSGGSAQTVGGVLMSGPPSTGGPAPPHHVNGWINQATKILEAQGIPASKLSPQDIWIVIQHESGGDPSAVNGWDSNAAAGTPSTGIMQCIQPTFNAYALPGHGNIYNPVDNIIAGVRYALARYGSLDNVPGVAAVHNGQPYVGY